MCVQVCVCVLTSLSWARCQAGENGNRPRPPCPLPHMTRLRVSETFRWPSGQVPLHAELCVCLGVRASVQALHVHECVVNTQTHTTFALAAHAIIGLNGIVSLCLHSQPLYLLSLRYVHYGSTCIQDVL